MFPDELLRDVAFLELASDSLRDFAGRWQAASDVEAAAPARARWEALKDHLRLLATARAREVRCIRRGCRQRAAGPI